MNRKGTLHPLVVLAIIIIVGWLVLRSVEYRYVSVNIQNDRIVDASIISISKPFLTTIFEQNTQPTTLYRFNVSLYNPNMDNCGNQVIQRCRIYNTTIYGINSGLNIRKLGFDDTGYSRLLYRIDLYKGIQVVDSRTGER